VIRGGLQQVEFVRILLPGSNLAAHVLIKL
jgi:hypothetical protein